jgi:16S rRNA (adenine1518-N6/adenine1519-N6)-dimethyltransferase
VRLLQTDALKNKNELNPAILSAIAELQERFRCARLKLVANLPYAIATPVIANLLIGDQPVDLMIATVQWEIAERLTATPGTSEYGALAVLVQSLADVRIERRLAPSVFWPRPKVDSAIVRIDPGALKRAAVGNPASLRAFLRDLYVHRRKNLRGALIGWPSGRREKADVDELLAKLELPGTMRAEQLTLEQHRQLWRAFKTGA